MNDLDDHDKDLLAFIVGVGTFDTVITMEMQMNMHVNFYKCFAPSDDSQVVFNVRPALLTHAVVCC